MKGKQQASLAGLSSEVSQSGNRKFNRGIGAIHNRKKKVPFYNIKRRYYMIKTGSQDPQRLYEPFPDHFGSFRKKYVF